MWATYDCEIFRQGVRKLKGRIRGNKAYLSMMKLYFSAFLGSFSRGIISFGVQHMDGTEGFC